MQGGERILRFADPSLLPSFGSIAAELNKPGLLGV